VEEERFAFEGLVVYQRGLAYIDFVYVTTKLFPKSEIFSLTDQFRRAASSICFNIAEGSGGSKAEFKQFLKIAQRSARECVAITEVAFRQNYLTQEQKTRSRNFCLEISKMLNGLIKSIN
jgi:four helix bundle protein